MSVGVREEEAVLTVSAVEGRAPDFGAGVEAELVVDAAKVGIDGAPAEEKAVGDLGIGETGGDELDDLDLALAQYAGGAGDRRLGDLPYRRDGHLGRLGARQCGALVAA